MGLRITQGMLFRMALANLDRQRTRLAQTQEEASSGLRINRPSDDPLGAGAAASLRNARAGLQQLEENVSNGRARVGAADSAIANADDPIVSRLATRARRRLFSRRGRVEDGCYLEGDIIVEVDPQTGRKPLFHRDDVPLPGPHNLENAMAAALLSLAAGGDAEVISGTLAAFRGLPHRLERVAELHGVTWYDDSKATNIAATAKSLEGFEDGSVHLILGGRHKGGDASELCEAVRRKVDHLYLVGEAAEEFGTALGGLVETTMSGTVTSAVGLARRKATEGDVVLLSPACASFDQYRNFAERGDHFQELVRTLDG